MPFVRWISRLLRGSPLEAPARDLYTRLSRSKGAQYERDVLCILQRTLRSDSNAIDIGAFRGGVLAEILRLAPAGRHFAFEPIPEHFQYLAKSYPQVQVFPFALCDTAGPANFQHVLSRPTVSGLRPVPELTGGEKVERITVQTQTLDNLIPVDVAIHLIKIDVEGAEYLVLRGGRETIRRNRPVILFEHGLAAAESYQNPSASIYTLLVQECGLNIATLRGWLKGLPTLDQPAFAAQLEDRGEYYFIAYPGES